MLHNMTQHLTYTVHYCNIYIDIDGNAFLPPCVTHRFRERSVFVLMSISTVQRSVVFLIDT